MSAPVTVIDTSKLLNGCTVKASSKVTTPSPSPFADDANDRSARMPPGFMNAICGACPLTTSDGSLSWASAIRSPSGVSPAAFGVRLTSAPMKPICRFAIGATSVWYVEISAVRSAALGTSRVTIMFVPVTDERTMSPRRLS